jgi:hypothetical protein
LNPVQCFGVCRARGKAALAQLSTEFADWMQTRKSKRLRAFGAAITN